MPIHVQRTEFDPHVGYQYYVAFNENGSFGEEDVRSRAPVEVAASLCENGDLADFSFELPKYCRSNEALEFIRLSGDATYVEPRVYVNVPEVSGDTVVLAAGRLEMDAAGRIIGMDIVWAPVDLTKS